MRFKTILLIFLPFFSFGRVWYVSTTGNGTDGSNWALTVSLDYALNNANFGDEIWVQAGTYKPTQYPRGAISNSNTLTERDFAFHLVNGVKLYGGFSGNENSISERTTGFESILSGDIGVENDNSDNCFHIIISILDNSQTILDRFVLTAANADLSPNTANQVIIEGQVISRSYGGGIYNHSTSTIFNSVIIYRNNALYGGGIVNISNSFPTFKNCVILENNGYTSGGAVQIYGPAHPTFINTTLFKNTGSSRAIDNLFGYLTLINCIAWNNYQPSYGSAYVSYSNIENSSYGGNVISDEPQFVDKNNPRGDDGKFMTSDDGLRLKACSPSINTGTNNSGVNNDILGNSRPYDDKDISDMGAYEFQGQVVSYPIVQTPYNSVVCSPSTINLTASCKTGTVLWSNNSTTTSIVLSDVGTYSISAKCRTNECETNPRIPFSFTIGEKPNSPIVNLTTPSTVCSPNVIGLTGSCPTGYIVWNNIIYYRTDITINSVGTNSVSVKCVNSGCESNNTTISNLIINPKPPTPTIIAPSERQVCSPNTLSLTATGCSGTVNWSNGSSGSIITVSIAGTYALSATCTQGNCISNPSISTNLEIRPKPNPPANIVNPTICKGRSIILGGTCGGAEILKWYDSITGGNLLPGLNGLVSPNVTTSYYGACETLTCASIRSTSTVTVNEINAQASNTGPYLVGQNIELSASGGDLYAWSGPNSFTSTQQNPNLSNALLENVGIYSVTITKGNCTATVTTNVSINGIAPCTLGIDLQLIKTGYPYSSLFSLTDGMSINQITDEVSILAIPVCPTLNIESVHMQIQSATINETIIQNVSPYAIFDNTGTLINGRLLPIGTYTVTITGYSQDNSQGIVTYGPVSTTFTILPNAASISNLTLSKTIFCGGSSLVVSFSTTDNYNVGNKFNIELSDKNGNFGSKPYIGNTAEIVTFINPIVIGTTNSAGAITCTIPSNIESGNNYRIRVVSTEGVSISPVSTNTLTIHPRDLNLVSPTDDFSTNIGTKQASNRVTASNKVNATANVNYQAGKAIILNAGFEANAGAVFKAEIRGCEN